MTLTQIGQLGAAFGAVIAILTGLWKAGDYTGIRFILKNEFAQLQTQEMQTVQSVLILRFNFLIMKRSLSKEWTFLDQQELCAVGHNLNYIGVPGC